MRCDNKFERALPYIFYLPVAGIYLFIMFISALASIWLGLKLLCKSSDPSEKEIETVDANSIEVITLEKLTALNKERGDDRVRFGHLMLIYFFLNMRTEFEADDVFSQKTAILTHLNDVKENSDSYNDNTIVADEDDNDGFKRMNKTS